MNLYVDTAVRAWVRSKPPRSNSKGQGDATWRAQGFGERVLVWDTETTTDFTQRLLFGFYRIYVDGDLKREAIIIADDLSQSEHSIIKAFAAAAGLQTVTRTAFIDEVFYPEVYVLGSLCVGFNLPFDLSRIAVRAILGKGRNERKFTLQLSNRVRWPRLRIESIGPRAAFIGFAPKLHAAYWEKPLFHGRFLDLSTLSCALTGEKHTLRSAGKRFKAAVIKSKVEGLGKITPQTLAYGRHDVEATWSLYQCLLAEYLHHPFASLANEKRYPDDALPITKIFSAASIAKQYVHNLGFRPLLDKQPRYAPRVLGYAAAAYFGGRAEVRVRKVSVPVQVVDFTSMYPTIFILQNLQRMLSARYLRVRIATDRVRQLLTTITLEDLYNPALWPSLCALVQVKPDQDVLPVRARLGEDDQWVIPLAKISSDGTRWYVLADLVAAKVLGHKVPQVIYALDIVPAREDKLAQVQLRNQVELDANSQVFKTVVEERQKAKHAKADPEIARLSAALKIVASSGAYGIYFEINVVPGPKGKPLAGKVFSDSSYGCADVKDERPGVFCNPIIASFVTGGARLMLAMAEAEVISRGGTFAFCDTDSLAIVVGKSEIPHLTFHQVDDVVTKFDRLSPYDSAVVPHLLKREYESIENLQCFAISAKRYVLYTIDDRGRIKIIKASESGLGAIIGRTPAETLPKLAQRIWLAILFGELKPEVDERRARRLRMLIDFDQPLRYKIPLTKPRLLRNPGFRRFNRKCVYAKQIKPFGFLQALATDVHVDADAVRAIAPFERDLRKSRKLQWVDLETGKPITIDWSNQGFPDTVSVVSMRDFIKRFSRHPETKGADTTGSPSSEVARGVLGRLDLSIGEPERIGKEIDRLDEDEGIDLSGDGPLVYSNGRATQALESAIERLRLLPNKRVAAMIRIAVRSWKRIKNHHSLPSKPHQQRIVRAAARTAFCGREAPRYGPA